MPQYPHCYVLVPEHLRPASLGFRVTSLILFNADGAGGYPSYPGPTYRNGSHEETTFGAIHSITCSWQPAQARVHSPNSLLVHAEMDVNQHVLVAGGDFPCPVGTQHCCWPGR